MNFVIITALLSAGNSGLYSCTRMLHSLGEHGQAPRARQHHPPQPSLPQVPTAQAGVQEVASDRRTT